MIINPMTIKKIFLILFFVKFCLNINAQTPNWVWAKSAEGTLNDYSTDIITDVGGNVYITGYFQSQSITFGTITLNNINGGQNAFIVKYDASGNVLWAKSTTGTSISGNGISIDASGNVYQTGTFRDTTLTIGTTTLNSVSSGNIFVVKYDSNGNVLWAKSTGGGSAEYSSSITNDINGNVYITGYFSGVTINFGTTTLTNYGGWDMFVMKFNSNGDEIWAKSAGGSMFDVGSDISTDDSGNIYITGYFSSPSIQFGTTILTGDSSSFSDLFIVKYDSNGNLVWVKSAGGYGDDIGSGISTDASGNIYVLGHFNTPSITFGSITLTNTYGYQDVFIIKYTSNGNLLWAKSAGGNSHDYGLDISTDAYGNSFITGMFMSSSLIFGADTLINIGFEDIFIVKYNDSGNVLWAKSVGGARQDAGHGISSDVSGNAYITGFFRSSSITLGTTLLTNIYAGNSDIFIAKLNSITGLEENNSFINGINILPNPFSYSTTIQTNVFLKDACLSIFTINGQKVKNVTNIKGNRITVNRDNLPSGIYFIRLIENNKEIVWEKLVISD